MGTTCQSTVPLNLCSGPFCHLQEKEYSLNNNIRCLTEFREGCAGISNDQLLPTAPAALPATQPAATVPAATVPAF